MAQSEEFLNLLFTPVLLFRSLIKFSKIMLDNKVVIPKNTTLFTITDALGNTITFDSKNLLTLEWNGKKKGKITMNAIALYDAIGRAFS
jgi:hypothetical protein